ncbi:MAG: sterol desaturase family protein [Rhizobacter sp.]|nr:sterol desaturase family protein [Rhizobacter sp.]
MIPNPLELLLDPAALPLYAIYVGLIGWEAIAPARRLPAVRGWRLAGAIAFIGYFLLSSYLPLGWDTLLAPWQLYDLTELGAWGGAAAGLLVYETALYGWHRLMHSSDRLWLALHQMHHSAERLDSFSAFWFSPLDMVGFTALGSLCLVLLVGITPEAASIVLMTTFFLAIFQHCNIRTPRWLGWVVQRPEQHRVHHARGVHAYNYADLPLIDWLFGTFRNPADQPGETGFAPGASYRISELMLAHDVAGAPLGRQDEALAPTVG